MIIEPGSRTLRPWSQRGIGKGKNIHPKVLKMKGSCSKIQVLYQVVGTELQS